MAQIVFKEKDFEFQKKNRLVPLVQTSDNPLKPDRPKVQVQRGRNKNIQIKTTGNFSDPLARAGKTVDSKKPPGADPLSRNNPLSNDPLRGKSVRPPVQPQQGLQQSMIAPSEQQQVQVGGYDSMEQTKIQWELSSYWLEIRQDFVDIFDPKSYNLEEPITNPFGNQVPTMNTFDSQAKAHTGQSQIEYQQIVQKAIGPGKQISQKTYIQKVEEIRRDLRKNWINGDKVAALQLGIQSCKLLIDNEKILFAPIKYIYIIDILETFGKFVIERLLRLAYPNYSEQKLQETSLQSVVGSNISENAQEIGRNWIIKIGSIRELLPRLYVEATLLKVYYFTDPSKIRSIFTRLVKSVRAIGDYVNAMNFALYLFRLAAELFSGEKDFLLSTLKDFFIYMKQRKYFCKPGISDDQYMKLFEPFLKQVFRLYSQSCTEREFRELFEHFRQSNQSYHVLKKMIEVFPSINICQLPLELFSIMQSYQPEVKYQLNAVFLPKIAKGLTNKSIGVEICELVLADCKYIQSFPLYLDILASLIELIFRSFTGYQKSQFFFKILSKFNEMFLLVEKESIQQQTNKQVFTKLHQFILNLFLNAENIQEILQIDTFIQCIHYFPKDMKVVLCKDLLEVITQRDKNDRIEDPMCVHSILTLAQELNFKDNSTSVLEDRYLGQLINQFLKQVDFNRDLEQTLNLYGEVRSKFGNIGDIQENLVNRSIDLIYKAIKFCRGKISKKITQFFQACIAFSYITIPTIEDIVVKIRLYIQVAEIALSVQQLQQTDSLIRAAIELISSSPQKIKNQNSDEVLLPYMNEIISFLIVVPDDPESEYLQLYDAFQSAILNFTFSGGGSLKLQILTSCLTYLSCQVQERLPYRIENVKSNDQLFNKENAFKIKILEVVQEVYKLLGEEAQKITDKQISDSLENGRIIRNALDSVFKLLSLFRINQKNNQTVFQLINLISKKFNDLNKDRQGKVQISMLKATVMTCIQSVERTVGISLEEQTISITKIIEQNK